MIMLLFYEVPVYRNQLSNDVSGHDDSCYAIHLEVICTHYYDLVDITTKPFNSPTLKSLRLIIKPRHIAFPYKCGLPRQTIAWMFKHSHRPECYWPYSCQTLPLV